MTALGRPSEWDSFLSVKSVDRIEVTRQPQRATAATINVSGNGTIYAYSRTSLGETRRWRSFVSFGRYKGRN